MLSGIFTAISTLCIVAVIIYFSYVAAKFVAKGSVRASHSKYMRMVDQMPVGQNRAVSVIQVGDRYFLLGIAEKQIDMLAELEEEGLIPLEIEEAAIPTAMPDFKELMHKLGEAKKHWNDKK